MRNGRLLSRAARASGHCHCCAGGGPKRARRAQRAREKAALRREAEIRDRARSRADELEEQARVVGGFLVVRDGRFVPL